MARMIQRGRELLRISPKDSKKIEYSTNEGRTWYNRCNANSSQGSFLDLVDNGKEILAHTEKGLFYSTNEGRTWYKRS